MIEDVSFRVQSIKFFPSHDMTSSHPDSAHVSRKRQVGRENATINRVYEVWVDRIHACLSRVEESGGSSSFVHHFLGKTRDIILKLKNYCPTPPPRPRKKNPPTKTKFASIYFVCTTILILHGLILWKLS